MTERTNRPIDPTREYVVGGALRWYGAYQGGLSALPTPIDDLTAELGDDIYERMLRDPQIGAAVGVLRTAILEDGLTIRPAVDDADDDQFAQAVALVDLCERQLADLETPLDDVLYDLLSAVALGNRVAEEVYAYDASYTGKTELVLRRLNVKPRKNLAFVTDMFGNVVGMLGIEQGTPLLHGALLTEEQQARIIPRSKFAVLSFRPKDNDPRGDTVLRPAYNPWWVKQQLWPEYLKYLVQFASPSIDGVVAPHAQEEPIYDGAGNATGQYQTAEEAYLQKLLAFRNGTAIARPSGSELHLLWSSGDGQAFLNAFDLFDKQIAKAVLFQTLATEEGSSGTRAQGVVHQSILATQIRQAKRAVCRMVRRDVLRQIVTANAGDSARALAPYASLGDAESQDLSGLWTAAAQLSRAGYFDPSQLPGVDELLNLPPRLATTEEQQPAQDTPPTDDSEDEEEQPL